MDKGPGGYITLLGHTHMVNACQNKDRQLFYWQFLSKFNCQDEDSSFMH
jgi:hypothetical protein